MKYHFNHQIHNPDQTISDKVNYFADIFDYFLSNIGKPTFPGLETHKSILEKISFQLDNYSPHSIKYIKEHLKSEYLTSKDPIIKDYYLHEWKAINSYIHGGIEKNRNKLHLEIRQLIRKLDKSLFINTLSSIIAILSSESRLENDQTVNKLDYYTPIIISEFIFSGFDKKDLNRLFDKILTTKVEIQGNKVRTEVPLPTSLIKYKNKPGTEPEKFYARINKYLKSRTLQQQFEGIYYLYRNSQKEKTFIFYLNNIKSLTPLEIQIGDVRFSNQIKKENISKRGINKEYRSFFNGKGKLFAQTTLMENNDIIGMEKAIRKINNAINFLNACIKKKCYLQLDDYIVKDTDQNIRHKSMLIPIRSTDIEKLEQDNTFSILNSRMNSLTNRYLEIDKIYFYAATSDFPENKVINYWRFLESFFEAERFKSVTVIKSISKILATNCQMQIESDYYNLAFQIVHSAYLKHPVNNNGINPLLEIPDKDLVSFLNSRSNPRTDLTCLNQIIDHPFINQRLNWVLTTSFHQQTKVAQDFYQSILNETFEQRNFIEHRGIFFDKSIDKILTSLPIIVRDFRRLIINELTQKNYNKFNDVISSLMNKK